MAKVIVTLMKEEISPETEWRIEVGSDPLLGIDHPSNTSFCLERDTDDGTELIRLFPNLNEAEHLYALCKIIIEEAKKHPHKLSTFKDK